MDTQLALLESFAKELSQLAQILGESKWVLKVGLSFYNPFTASDNLGDKVASGII